MKNKSEMLLEIFKAQVSNKSAEACANISIWQLIFLIISSIFIISYPFINQRVKQSVTMSDARLYPGLGGVLQDIGKLDATFSVNADNNNEYKLMYSFNMPERFESNGWIVRFTKKSAEKVLAEEKTAAYQPIIVFSEDALLINQPQHQIKLSTKYNALGFFSASELRKVIGNKAEMITFTKSFLFSAAVAGTPTAILQMVGLMALQYAFYIVVAAFLLSMSRLRAMKGTNLEKISKFFPSVKILATLGFLPSIIVALISYFNSSFGMSFGWVVFCLIVGVRTIIIYMKRVRSKSVAEL
jgi:hypothetical protein